MVSFNEPWQAQLLLSFASRFRPGTEGREGCQQPPRRLKARLAQMPRGMASAPQVAPGDPPEPPPCRPPASPPAAPAAKRAPKRARMLQEPPQQGQEGEQQ